MDSTVDMDAALKEAFAVRHGRHDSLAAVSKPAFEITELQAVKRLDGDFHVEMRRGRDSIVVIMPPDDFRTFIENARSLLSS